MTTVYAPLLVPISAQLDAALKASAATVPSGKQGAARVSLSHLGVDLSLGYKPRQWFELSGYASRLWGTGGWQGAARAGVTW